MKLFNNIFTLGLLVSSVALTACDYEDDYTPGVAPGEGEVAIVFAESAQNTFTLDMATTEVPVKLQRAETSGEETVEIVADVLGTDASNLEIPSTVSFADGEAEATLVIKTLETFPTNTEVKINLSIASDNPYTTANVMTYINLFKEDYTPVATGIYANPMFYDGTYEAVLEYSPSLDSYRFKDPWMMDGLGDAVTFKWERGSQDVTFVPATTFKGYPAFASGYNHPSYGMIYAACEAAMYDAANDRFLFSYSWIVDAGSFGSMVDQFVVTQWAE